MYRYSSSLNYLAFAEFFDSVGKFDLSDRYLRIAHNKYKNIKTADVNHWTKFTNFDDVATKLTYWQNGFLNFPEIFKQKKLYPCGILKTIVDGEQIEIPVYFDPFDNSSYYDTTTAEIVIANKGKAQRAIEVLAHEINHAYEDILKIKKFGILKPYVNFDQLSQTTWSQKTIDEVKGIWFKNQNITLPDEYVKRILDDLFNEDYKNILNMIFENNEIIDQRGYIENLVQNKKLSKSLTQLLTNDLKRMTLGYRKYIRLQDELRSRLSEILISLSKDSEKQKELLNATKEGKETREIFENYFKEILGKKYNLLKPKQKDYILRNVYQSLIGGRPQTIIKQIINFTQNGIKYGIFPKNIGQMNPIQIKNLLRKVSEDPNNQKFIEYLRGKGYSDADLINLIQKAANNQLGVQTAVNSGKFSFMEIKEIIQLTQHGIKNKIFPENIGQMKPEEIKKLFEQPELQKYISSMQVSTKYSDDELINLIQKAANNQIGKTQGAAGNALNAKNVVIGASELEAKTLELRNIATSVKNILNKQINIPSWLTKSLTTILEFVERYIPQVVKTFLKNNSSTINSGLGYVFLVFELYNTLINLRNAIYIYQKSSELPATEKELKNDFNLQARGQLVTAITSFAGVLGNPKSPISIKDPVVMSVLTAANLIGQTFGGTETSASFSDIDMASTSYIGYENAMTEVNRNANLRSLWPSIKSLVENNLTGNFGTLLQSTLASKKNISEAEKGILTSAALGYRQKLRKQKNLKTKK